MTPEETTRPLDLSAEAIDECVKGIFRDCIRPQLRPIYREILGESFPKPDPSEFLWESK